MKRIWNFFKEEDGMELTEYAVMGALIVLAVSVAVVAMRDQIVAALNRITAVLTGAV